MFFDSRSASIGFTAHCILPSSRLVSAPMKAISQPNSKDEIPACLRRISNVEVRLPAKPTALTHVKSPPIQFLILFRPQVEDAGPESGSSVTAGRDWRCSNGAAPPEVNTDPDEKPSSFLITCATGTLPRTLKFFRSSPISADITLSISSTAFCMSSVLLGSFTVKVSNRRSPGLLGSGENDPSSPLISLADNRLSKISQTASLRFLDSLTRRSVTKVPHKVCRTLSKISSETCSKPLIMKTAISVRAPSSLASSLPFFPRGELQTSPYFARKF
mmetsp:Transcript_23447/g.33678  ORF Transcript_23447/g.33678 Transcript_23447/m.33678 type:complete len:274 (+) Transcript_23447:48-869(+)